MIVQHMSRGVTSVELTTHDLYCCENNDLDVKILHGKCESYIIIKF